MVLSITDPSPVCLNFSLLFQDVMTSCRTPNHFLGDKLPTQLADTRVEPLPSPSGKYLGEILEVCYLHHLMVKVRDERVSEHPASHLDPSIGGSIACSWRVSNYVAN